MQDIKLETSECCSHVVLHILHDAQSYWLKCNESTVIQS